MSDLVERLRNCGVDRDPFKTYAICDQAAARIEALEAALREILNTADPYGVECIAKEALAKGQDK